MKKKITLFLMLLIKISYSNLEGSIKNTPKEIKVDIIAEINSELTITDETGKDITGLVFYHGEWDASNSGVGSSIGQKIQINGAPIGGEVKFEIKGELRSKSYLVHEQYNDVELLNNENSWNPGVSDKYRGVVLPHEYILNIESGTDGITGAAELSYQSNYDNQGGTVAKTAAPFNIINEKVELDIISRLQGFWRTVNSFDKYPGRYYNRSTLKIIITQP